MRQFIWLRKSGETIIVKFQKVVKDVCLEKAYRSHEPIVVVQFKKTRTTPEFSYAPMYSELAEILRLLIEKYSAEEVFKELGLKIMLEFKDKKSNEKK